MKINERTNEVEFSSIQVIGGVLQLVAHQRFIFVLG
jgi:hypothetical protein